MVTSVLQSTCDCGGSMTAVCQQLQWSLAVRRDGVMNGRAGGGRAGTLDGLASPGCTQWPGQDWQTTGNPNPSPARPGTSDGPREAIKEMVAGVQRGPEAKYQFCYNLLLFRRMTGRRIAGEFRCSAVAASALAAPIPHGGCTAHYSASMGDEMASWSWDYY
ncbi:unnamed protein product [Calypogeia fissa]